MGNRITRSCLFFLVAFLLPVQSSRGDILDTFRRLSGRCLQSLQRIFGPRGQINSANSVNSLEVARWTAVEPLNERRPIQDEHLLRAAINYGLQSGQMTHDMFTNVFGIVNGVKIFKIVTVSGKQIILLRSATFYDDSEEMEWSDRLWAFCFVKIDDQFQFQKISESFRLPSKLRVGFGSIFPDSLADGSLDQNFPSDLFYAEISDASVEAAFVSILTEEPYGGFSGAIDSVREKHAYDPSPGRTWRLRSGGYSLRRGSSAEILDVRASQLDGDFDAYFRGSGGFVAPWNASFIRRVQLNGKWLDLVRWNGRQTETRYLELSELGDMK